MFMPTKLIPLEVIQAVLIGLLYGFLVQWVYGERPYTKDIYIFENILNV